MEMSGSLLKQFSSVTSCWPQKKLLILIYHRVLEHVDWMRPDEVDQSLFAWQMDVLAKHFNVLSLAEALQRLKSNTLPPRAVCITFDDGYADNYLNALPILLQHRLTATFFVASSFLDGGRMWNDTVSEAIRHYDEAVLDLSPLGLGTFEMGSLQHKPCVAADVIAKIKYLPYSQRTECVEFIADLAREALPTDLMMTTQQLLRLRDAGMEIGGHTATHPILATLDREQACQEIRDNKKVLEQKLNQSIRYFAYPNGKPGRDYRLDQVDLVKEQDYEAAVSTTWGVSTQSSDRWQLPRATPWDRTPEKFMLRLAAIYGGLG